MSEASDCSKGAAGCGFVDTCPPAAAVRGWSWGGVSTLEITQVLEECDELYSEGEGSEG